MTRRPWPKETHDHLEAKIQKIREALMDEAERLAEQRHGMRVASSRSTLTQPWMQSCGPRDCGNEQNAV